MIRQGIAVVLCGALMASGCATISRPAAARFAQALPRETLAPHADKSAIASFAQKLPVGTRVKVERVSGGSLKGTLLTASDDTVVVQRNTRVPESPVTIPLSDVARITIDTGSGNLGRSIAIGAAVGAGAALGILAILAALLND